MHSLGLVGGTFDRFHAGHRALIDYGLSKCQRLEVWLTNDQIAQAKDSRIESWSERSQKLLQSISEDPSRIFINILEDEDGPAPWHEKASAILCTPETVVGCQRINHMRESNGLKTLEILKVEHVIGHDGKPISSSRIRQGKIDKEGQSYLPEDIGKANLILTKEVESNLKDPFGRLFEGPEDDTSVAIRAILEETFGSHGPIIAVGDVTVKALQDLGSPADIALIDGKTKRQEWLFASKIDHTIYDTKRSCINPPGQLSIDLFEACNKAISNWNEGKRTCIIEVEGEEDLAPLLLHPLAPLGAVVLYGQPNRGVVLRWTGFDSKSRCRDLLNEMQRA